MIDNMGKLTLLISLLSTVSFAGSADCNGGRAQFAVGAGFAYPGAAPAGHGSLYAPLAANHAEEAAPVAVAGVLRVGEREGEPPSAAKPYQTGFQELPSKGGAGLSSGFFGTVSCGWGSSSQCSRDWNSGISGE